MLELDLTPEVRVLELDPTPERVLELDPTPERVLELDPTPEKRVLELAPIPEERVLELDPTLDLGTPELELISLDEPIVELEALADAMVEGDSELEDPALETSLLELDSRLELRIALGELALELEPVLVSGSMEVVFPLEVSEPESVLDCTVE